MRPPERLRKPLGIPLEAFKTRFGSNRARPNVPPTEFCEKIPKKTLAIILGL